MHKDWCGKPCCDCENPCKLDEILPCSPDCECLGRNGEHLHPECQDCDALPEHVVNFTLKGSIRIRATSYEEAVDILFDMDADDAIIKASSNELTLTAEAENQN